MRTWSLAIVTAAAVGLAACGTPEPAADDLSALHAALVEREAAHHDLAAAAAVPAEVHAECEAYAVEMAERMETMRSTCRRRMGDADYGRTAGVAGTVAERIEEHRARCLEAGGLDELRDECAAHHREMGRLLEELGGTMRSTGMMGGDRGSCGR